MENSKAALNIWCSKKKLTVNYEITGGPADGGFTCKVTVNSISYTANGTASSKKVASVNAAFAMLAYLINSKHLAERELLQSCYEILKIRNALFPGGVPVKLDSATSDEQQPPEGLQVVANVNASTVSGNFAYLNQGYDPLVSLTSTPLPGPSPAASTSSNVIRHARAPRPGPYPLPHQRRSGQASQCGSFTSQKSHSQQQLQGEFAPADAWDRYGPSPGLAPRPVMPLPMARPRSGLLPTPSYYDDYSNNSYGLLPSPPGGPYPHYPPQQHHDPCSFNDPFGQPYWQDNHFNGPPPPDYHGNRYDNGEYAQEPNGAHYSNASQQHYDEPPNLPLTGSYRQYKAPSAEELSYRAQNGADRSVEQANGASHPYFDASSRIVAPTKANAEPINGGYTLGNAKQLLHQFMQRHRIKTQGYGYDSSGPNHFRTFSARFKLSIPQYGREIDLTEKAGSKQEASRLVALRILQQLFGDGLIEKFDSDAPSKRQLMKNCLIYEISISPALKRSMMTMYSAVQAYNSYLNSGIALQSYGPSGTGYSYPTSEPMRAQPGDQFQAPNCLYWCPPMADLNPWTNRPPDDPVFAGMPLAEVDAQLHADFLTMIKNPAFQQILAHRMKLPIYYIKEQVIELTKHHSVVIIKGSTGCGKTTQVPQFILDSFLRQGRGSTCSIVVTQPRRISAISLSERVAAERLEALNEGQSSVGYSVRFDHTYPRPYGSILFCTTGHLLRRIQSGLRGISHLIIDEVHERDLYTDLLLVMVRDLLRHGHHLRVIIMSATLSVSHFQAYFNNCPVIEIQGALFPVKRHFLEDTIELLMWNPKSLTYLDDDGNVSRSSLGSSGDGGEESKEETAQMIIDDVGNYSPKTIELMGTLREGVICFELILGILEYIQKMDTDGHVLIFLPGWTAIFELLKYLKAHPTFGNESHYLLLPLHSQLPTRENHRVFAPVTKRKIILSTNIAETSITIDGVVYIIDTCLCKRKSLCARTNVTSCLIDWVSKANVAQREGRAGRVRPGVYFALCSRRRYQQLEDFQVPQILGTSLVETCLLIKYLGLGDIPVFLSNCLDRPSCSAVAEALAILREIGAFNEAHQLTPLGDILVKLPIDPRLGRALMLSVLLDVAAPALTIVAASTIQTELFNTVSGTAEGVSRFLLQLDENQYSDHLIQCKVFSAYEKGERGVLSKLQECLNLNALTQISHARRQLAETLIRCGFPPERFLSKKLCTQGEMELLLGPLVAAFYPNVALHKEGRAILTNEAKIGLIHKSSVLYSHIQASSMSKLTSLKSPLFVYSEKSVNGRLICSKTLSMVSFLQFLLFGVRRTEFPAPANPALASPPSDTILLDGWLEIRLDPHVFDCTLLVKRELEKILSKVCTSPASLWGLTQLEETVLRTVKEMTSMDSVGVAVKVGNAKPAVN